MHVHEDTHALHKVKSIHISADLTVVVAIQINSCQDTAA